MPMQYNTWEKAEKRYKEMGMSENQIGQYKKSWMKKHKKDTSIAGKIKSRKKTLEELEQSLDGKEF